MILSAIFATAYAAGSCSQFTGGDLFDGYTGCQPYSGFSLDLECYCCNGVLGPFCGEIDECDLGFAVTSNPDCHTPPNVGGAPPSLPMRTLPPTPEATAAPVTLPTPVVTNAPTHPPMPPMPVTAPVPAGLTKRRSACVHVCVSCVSYINTSAGCQYSCTNDACDNASCCDFEASTIRFIDDQFIAKF
jgi:hypothetical protein